MMNWMRKLMYGRYGTDQLSLFLLFVYLLGYLLSILTRIPLFNLLGMAAILWSFFRIFSRRIDKRRAENVKFMALAGPVIRWFKMRRTIHRDKEHCYFKCPSCGQYLRVPRGKGKITISCRNCGMRFEEKS